MPDLSDNTSTTGILLLGSTNSNTIDFAGDQDWFSVSLVAGYTYIFSLYGSATGKGTLYDPLIVGLYHSSGNIYENTRNDDLSNTSRDARIYYTPSVSGGYYISVGGYGVGTGTYQLNLSVVDPPASIQTTAVLPLAANIAGVVDSAGDVDWFKVVLAGGVSYVITENGSPTSQGTLANPKITGVYNGAGSLLNGTGNDDYGGSRNARVLFTAPSSGTYYVAAAGSGSSTGSYALSIQFANALAATHIESTSATGSRIAVINETDWYKVYLVAYTSYNFNMIGQEGGGGTLFDPDITGIYLPNGAPVAGSSNDNYNGSRNAYVSLTTSTTGTYYVAVAGHGRTTGTYTLLVNSADGVTADTSTNATLTLGSVQSGWINQPGDVDWLRVVLEGGVTYMTSMDSPRVTYGALYDPKIIGVYSSSGGYYANTGNDNYGTSRNSRASFTPVSSGTYYVAVSANGNGVGSYTLTTQFIGATLATNLNVNVAVTGNISVREEVDWFRIQLQGGATYTLSQRGRSSSGGTLFDPQLLGVFTQSGNLVSGTANDNTNASRDATASFSVASSGTYYVGARGHGVYTGSYTLSLTMTDQAPASMATTAEVTQATNVTGAVHFANDVDWIQMVLTADTPYAIFQWGSATGRGTLVNPYIQGIYDSGGSLLANTSNDNYGSNKDARVFFTPVSSGTYYAAMRGMGTGTGSYTVGLDLALELSPTSLALNTPLSRSIASSGEVDWYAVNLIEGMSYSFQQSGRYTNKGTLVNPKIMGLYTKSGALIAQTTNDNINSTNPNAEVAYTPVASGTYYLAVSAGDAGTGTYTISMQTNDLPAAIITEGYITVNDKMVSSIEVSGDVDWISLVMYQDMRYDISLNGLPTNQGTLRDPVIIGLQNYLGAAILNSGNDNNGSSLNALVSYTPTVSSLYYIAVGGKNTYTGTYTLEVRSPDTAGDVTTTRTLAVGGTLYSYIDQAGDRDWFAITLTEGLYYTVAMQTISLSDPYLAGVYSNTGQLLANTTNDNVSSSDLNAQVVFVAPSSGTYYIGAGSSNSATGSYSLALQTVAVAASGRQRMPAIHRESEFVFQPVGMQEVVDGSLMAETTSLAVAPSSFCDLSLPLLDSTPAWAVLTAG